MPLCDSCRCICSNVLPILFLSDWNDEASIFSLRKLFFFLILCLIFSFNPSSCHCCSSWPSFPWQFVLFFSLYTLHLSEHHYYSCCLLHLSILCIFHKLSYSSNMLFICYCLKTSKPADTFLGLGCWEQYVERQSTYKYVWYEITTPQNWKLVAFYDLFISLFLKHLSLNIVCLFKLLFYLLFFLVLII